MLFSATFAGCDPSSSGGGIDPGVIEIPVAFVNRPIPLDDMGNPAQADLRDPRLFSAGGDAYLRETSTADATVTNITRAVTGGSGDVKGLNASHDGDKLIFSLRLFDPDPNDDIVPSWNVYEYDLPTATLRRIIVNQAIAEQGDDLFPAYLPDGRIVFSSSRQRQSQGNLVNEGKQIFSALTEDRQVESIALVLHVMNPDGSDIRQISMNRSHDLYPQVLENINGGQILFTRWDHAGGNNGMHLYRMNPDGSDLELVYGSHSHATGTGGANVQFTGVREMQNGDLLAVAKPFTGTFDGGDLWIIDADRFADHDRPIWQYAGLSGPAQLRATVNNITTDGSISRDGRYNSAFPLRDGSNRILVSKSTCQVDVNGTVRPCIDPYVNDPNAQEVSPAYAIWIYDTDVDTEKPIVLAEPGRVITEAIALRPRPRPPVIFDKTTPELDGGWEAENLGVINIKSVYDMADMTFNGCFFNICTPNAAITEVEHFADPQVNMSAAERPARFVRFVKPVALPDPDDPNLANPPDLDNTAFGLQRNLGMREIVGYAPVEPDGSVKVKVPANLPLGVEVLDGEGRRIGPRHDNWFQVLPGDTLTCNGCHDHATGGATPEVHGRRGAAPAPSINDGIGITLQFPNTQIPGTAIEYWSTNLGETMAEVRFDRVGSALPPAPEPRLAADLAFVDYWTDPMARPADASYAYNYDDLDPSVLTPAPPAKPLRNANCDGTNPPQTWQHNCRVVINYPRHIHAIWQLPRGAADNFAPLAPANPVDPANPTAMPLLVDNMNPDGIPDETCVTCHTTANGTRIPYGQLDLTTDPNQDPNDFYRAFRDLLLSKQGQEIDGGGNLVNIQIPDGMGGMIDNPASLIAPRMSSNGARASFFVEKMTGSELDAGRALPATTFDHTGLLTGAELKLIAEWLDLGGQNFNDPFDPAAPQN